MNIMTLLPFIVLIGAMFLMTRSAKKKQQAAAQMRNEMQPGTGVRTIGGMYATVKEIHDDAVLLEVAPGVHALYAKNAIGAVLPDDEYNRIIDGAEQGSVVPDDLSSLTGASAVNDGDDDTTGKGDVAEKIDLGKDAPAEKTAEKADEPKAEEPKADETPAAAADAEAAEAKDVKKDAKKDGGADAK
ncbi:preprotein translocase subunit YajC [Streptomyces purpurogeneiscleroticus]|uniref:preprotein translocase subunit YajC n=1 Tax=Streptomyces purpurogeneiscleroticus TaxID=68259 RepID=UPI001CBE73AA|nr:preprotein translocase subunit YajC [Streptomyces purpurogeneiscleroticus]MBZ4020575.1 preprotein translocase subunit YajC [Streptomyces purpurogeneiscleroticus]